MPYSFPRSLTPRARRGLLAHLCPVLLRRVRLALPLPVLLAAIAQMDADQHPLLPGGASVILPWRTMQVFQGHITRGAQWGLPLPPQPEQWGAAIRAAYEPLPDIGGDGEPPF